ncbi:MAG: helix-turn-helix transcriptional regulator [Lachnospiraceae bacterium]|nr:helix-turn-helix transcriptional regulator [Lachnospiraceae bacterium]
MTLPEKIMLLRKQKGWSQEELADRMDISRQSVSKWESGASLPELDKIIKISEIFDVTTDFLLKENEGEIWEGTMVQTEGSEMPDVSKQRKAKPVSLEEARSFLEESEKCGKRLAGFISLIIVGAACLILLQGWIQYRPFPALKGTVGEGVAEAVFMIFVAIGATGIVLNGIKLSKFEYLEKEPILPEAGIAELVKEKKAAFEKQFQFSVGGGIAFVLLGITPMVLLEGLDDEWINTCATGFFMGMVALASFLFVSAGIVRGSFDKLLQEGDYTKEKKTVRNKIEPLAGIYWCIVAAIYLGISFYTNAWDRTWIIWPITGVLFGAVSLMATALSTKDSRN